MHKITDMMIIIMMIMITTINNQQSPIPPPPPMAPMGKMTFFPSILNTTCERAATQLFSRPLCFLVIELLKAIVCFN